MITTTILLSAALLGGGDPLDSLAEATARGIARFADRRAAIAAGYRRIGTDFPGMGEHWLHPGALLSRRIDPERPTMLAYATLDGRVTLLGAGYVITTRGDSATNAPGWPQEWHEHSGLLADESGAGGAAPATRPHEQFAAHAAGAGGASGMMARDPLATRVWVLHIWTALPNPDGRYTPDNWTLPFARAAIAAPSMVDPDIGRAFSLGVGGGDEYLRRVLTDAGLRTPAAAAGVDRAITDARAVATAVQARALARGSVAPSDLQLLTRSWETLARQLRGMLGPAVDPILAPPHRAGHAH